MIPEQSTGQLDASQVVVCFLLPTDQNAAPARQPSEEPLTTQRRAVVFRLARLFFSSPMRRM